MAKDDLRCVDCGEPGDDWYPTGKQVRCARCHEDFVRRQVREQVYADMPKPAKRLRAPEEPGGCVSLSMSYSEFLAAQIPPGVLTNELLVRSCRKAPEEPQG